MTATFMTLNATLVVELVVFVIVLAVLARFVVRPLQRAMRERQAEIDEALEKARRVEELLARTEADYEATLAQARREAQQIIEAGRRVGSYMEHQRRDSPRPWKVSPVAHGRSGPAMDSRSVHPSNGYPPHAK
jgi:F-type H+-transporting ATPase subunit b